MHKTSFGCASGPAVSFPDAQTLTSGPLSFRTLEAIDFATALVVHGAPARRRGTVTQAAPKTSDTEAGEGCGAERGVGKVRALKQDAVVLLVEDNIIFSLDAEDMLRRLGVATVVIRNQTAAAIELIDSQVIDFAFLDIKLGKENSLPVAQRLRTSGIPFVFVSDCDDLTLLPQEFADAAVLSKPYTMESLKHILAL